jgi:hypothetical protein
MGDGHHHPDTKSEKAGRQTGIIQAYIAYILPGENDGED